MGDDVGKVGSQGLEEAQGAGSPAGSALKRGAEKGLDTTAILGREVPKLALGAMALVGAGLVWLLVLRSWGKAAILAAYLCLLAWSAFRRQDTSRLPWLEVLGVLLLALLLASTHKPVKPVSKATLGKAGKVEEVLKDPVRTMRTLTEALRLSEKERAELEKNDIFGRVMPLGWPLITATYRLKAILAPVTAHPRVWWAGLWYGPTLIRAMVERSLYKDLPRPNQVPRWKRVSQLYERLCKEDRELKEAQTKLARAQAEMRRIEAETVTPQDVREDVRNLRRFWQGQGGKKFKLHDYWWTSMVKAYPWLKDLPKKERWKPDLWRKEWQGWILSPEQTQALLDRLSAYADKLEKERQTAQRRLEEAQKAVQSREEELRAEAEKRIPRPKPPKWQKGWRLWEAVIARPDTPGGMALRIAILGAPFGGFIRGLPQGAGSWAWPDPSWARDADRIKLAFMIVVAVLVLLVLMFFISNLLLVIGAAVLAAIATFVTWGLGLDPATAFGIYFYPSLILLWLARRRRRRREEA